MSQENSDSELVEEHASVLAVSAAPESSDGESATKNARKTAWLQRLAALKARRAAGEPLSEPKLETKAELEPPPLDEELPEAPVDALPPPPPPPPSSRRELLKARAKANLEKATKTEKTDKTEKTETPKVDPRSMPKPDPTAEPPKTELRLRRLAPLEPDRSRTYAVGIIGVLVCAGIGLLLASPKRPSVPTPPPLALTSGDIGKDGGREVAEAKEVPIDAAPAQAIIRPPPAWRVSALKDDASVDYIEGTFGKKGLVASLTAAGLSRPEIKRLNKSFDDVKHIDRPNAGDKFILAKDKKSGNVVAFEYIASPFEVWQARVDPDAAAEGAKDAGAKAAPLALDAKKLESKTQDVGVLHARRLELFIEHKHLASAVVIKEDLAKTVAANNLRAELVDEIDDALEGHLEDGIHTGARIRFVSTEDLVDGTPARVHLDAVELVPRTGSPIRVYFYERGSEVEGSSRRAPAAGFYDGKGRQPYHGQFRPPLQLARITSRFNPNRMHPVLHVIMPHNGVDFAGSTGTPIYAAASGTILTAGDSGPCGNMVSIDHGGGITTSYCHMSRIAPGIHPGLKVESRQNIGFIGATGRVTGPHLHFVAKRNGVFIDPMTLKMDGVRVLPPADRDAFAKKRSELDSAIDSIALPSAPTGNEAPEPDDEDKDLHE